MDANGGGLTVSAVSSPTLIALAAGEADANQVAFGGSVTVNSVANTVAATSSPTARWFRRAATST